MVENIRPETVPQWLDMFFRIYGERNQRLYHPSEILLQVWEEVSKIEEHLRKDRRDVNERVIKHVPVMLGWLMAFWNYRGLPYRIAHTDGKDCGVDLEGATWHKFPAVCPYCKRTERCMCIVEDLAYNPENDDLNRFRRDIKNRPRTIAGWQKCHATIYGRVNKIKTIHQVFCHFKEELGEMSFEHRHKNFPKFMNESADVFMWLCAFATRLESNLDEITWMTYPGQCNICRKEVCECPYM